MDKRTYTTFAGKIWTVLLLLMFAMPVLAVGTVATDEEDLGNGTTTVYGVVIDKKTEEPLIGASVAIWKDGEMLTGVSTDIEGAFRITAPVKEFEVVVSFVGYKDQRISSNSRKLVAMRIEMEEDSNTLSDVVITGFVSKNKETFTGSVTEVSGMELRQVSGTNLIGAISALTPGMSMVQNTTQGSNPNHTPELVLRGMSSFSNSGQQVNQPTIILDGTEISMEELYDLDINEVEKITVLKDASATALYGSKAANGVIVITRKPILESTVRVQYNFTGNLQFPVLSDYSVLNAREKLEYERLAGLYDAKGAINSTTGLPLQYEYDELYNQRYKLIAAGFNSDWLSQPARTAFSHDHSLRVYGGASNLRYELTGRFGDTRGVMKDDYRKRYSLGFKLDYYIGTFTISNRTTYQEVSSKNTPYGSFSQYVKMNPYDRMYNSDGTVNTDLSWENNNPLYEATLGSFSKNGTRTLSNSTDLRWDISKMFLLTGHFNVSSEMGSSDDFTSPKSLWYKDETDLTKKGQYIKGTSKGVSYNGNLVGTFNKFFKDESLVSLSAGWEINYAEASSAQMTAIGFFKDHLYNVGNAVAYPIEPEKLPSGVPTASADVGFFVTGNASFRNRYFVDATWRTTGSSLFGENNRFGHFWSSGLGWNVMNEPFMKRVKKHFDVFKVRGSVGYTGKVSFSPFQAVTMYEYSSNYEYKNGIGAVPITIGNVDLTWERTMNYNVGIDLSMFDRRLNFTVDAYIRNTTDLLLDKSYAPSTGITMAKSNLGELQNKGIEFQVDGYIFRNNDFYWRIATTGYMNRNKIIKITDNALKEINKQNENMASTNMSNLAPLPQYAEGESVTALKLVRSAGIDPATGKEIYIKRNGEYTFKYDPADKVLIGDTEPAYNGTFSTNVFWKGFSVYALFNFRMGAWIYNTTRVSKVEGSDPRYNADKRVFDDRWKEPGNVAIYKDIADSSRPEQTTRFAELENTLTLGTLNLSYEFSDKVCKKLKMRNLRTGINFTDILRLSTVKIERGTDYLYSQGFEMFLNVTF
ncbi:MAG: SusC/RagA family TonB-linked outer membrane protein [Bacteroidaceae bacterium]|nr:SusC/RagA family TonB-linked outer membrane protein [Bacteroidaceae bacterium]